MLILFFFVLSFTVVVVQTTLSQLFPDWLGRPDFLYILVVFAAYRFSWIHGLVFVFMIGWMLDVVSGIQVGLYPLMNILIYSTLKMLTDNSPLKENAYHVPLVGMSYFVVQMVFYFLSSVFMPGGLPDWSWNKMVQETIILILATIPTFVVLNFFYEFFNKRRVIHRVIRKSTGNQFR